MKQPFLMQIQSASERGVYIPLLAVISLVVLTILITFGIDSSTIRQASKALEQFNEQVCRETAARATLQSQAAELFARQINAAVANNLIKNVNLIEAILTVPTMPEDGPFGFSKEVPTPTPFVAGVGRDFNQLQIPLCNINCDSLGCTDCVFIGDVKSNDRFPDKIWDNLRNVGSTAGCELKGTIKTVLSGQVIISARTSWMNTVRGEFTPAPLALDSNDIPNLPALSIIVAPQMQSRAGDYRFRFSSGVASRSYEDGFRSAYDPLYQYQADGGGNGLNSFKGQPAGASYSLPFPTPPPTSTPSTPTAIPTATATGTIIPTATPTVTPTLGVPRPLKISGKCRSSIDGSNDCDTRLDLPNQERNVPSSSQYGELPECASMSGSPAPDPGTNCVHTSDREEMLVACMNPVVLVRNSLLSLITEFAMRHGELRNMTEILMANPSSRQKTNPYPSDPVEVVPLGADLASRDYQMPNVFFNGGSSGNVLDHTDEPHKYGVINPFSQHQHPVNEDPDIAKVDIVLRQYHRLISNQLRWCYQMYGGYRSPYYALDRYDISDPDLSNQGFEPNSADEPFWFDLALRPQQYGLSSTDPWDQECAWKEFAPSCPMPQTRGLNAPELIASMGSVQLCPYQMAGLPSHFTPIAGPPETKACIKPANPEDDLRGDLLASLCHLIGPDATSSKCPGRRRAIRSPGVFAMAHPEADYPEFSTVASQPAYSDAINLNSAILLVTHQALTNSERDDIKDLVEEGHFDKRPITVIYIPAFGKPATEAAGANQSYLNGVIDDFKEAFQIPEQLDPTIDIGPGNRDNALFVLSPYLESFNCHADTTSQCFAEYWKHILVGSGEGSVEVTARNIFFRRILKLKLKY